MNHSENSSVLTLTTAAATKVKSILQSLVDEGDPTAANFKLRLSVTGGGCSGFKYDFALTESREPDDCAVEKEGVTLVVDPMSLQYLQGAEVDYQEDPNGEQFVIRNPNAASTCGCGSSFSAQTENCCPKSNLN